MSSVATVRLTTPTQFGIHAQVNKDDNLSHAHFMNPPVDEVEYWSSLMRKNLLVSRRLQDFIDHDMDDNMPLTIDEAILQAPRRGSSQDALASQIASLLYPAPLDSLGPLIKYEKDTKTLRNLVVEQRKAEMDAATERNSTNSWIKRILSFGEGTEIPDKAPLDNPFALPMPVEVSDKASLAPFFAHLRHGGTHESVVPSISDAQPGVELYSDIEILQFPKGVVYSDGRVDLCKMVTGPRNIGDLMDSLKPNTFAKHFLLGNNIIGPAGARAIAAFIKEHPDRFQTWYLAGNCLDAAGLTSLVDSMIQSPVITNVWLKRNPLGRTTSNDLFRLITQCKNLRTLDLDQTELGDEAVGELFKALSNHHTGEPLALRHIYLNATGIGPVACEQIAVYLSSPHCILESLYMGCNPIGHAIASLARGIKANKSLKRLSIRSCDLKSSSTIALLKAITGHPTIEMLDLGQAYATEDLGMRYNWLTDDAAESIVNLIQSTGLKHLEVSYNPITIPALNKILSAAIASSTLCWFEGRPLTKGQRDPASVHAGQEHVRLLKLCRQRMSENVRNSYGCDYTYFMNNHKRFLVSPQDVRLIDSVYRNRDAGLARRGLKRLDKWWDEGDETLRQVQDGTFV